MTNNSHNFQKGISLEILTAGYFQTHGYFVKKNINLSASDGTGATDIDVLAIKFNSPLYEERIVIDCKDRKRPRPFERILWTAGLSLFSRANRSIVVLPYAPWQAREFASLGKVEILEVDEIHSYLQSISKSFCPFGDADPVLIKQLILEQKRINSPEGKELQKADNRLRQILVTGSPLTNLNRIIHMLSIYGKPNVCATYNWYKKYVCFNAAIIASVMLVRFAAESKWTPEIQWSDFACKKLTYGDISLEKARQLTKLALSYDISKGLPKPQYTEEILQIIKSLIAQPRVAAYVPYTLDLHLFGQVLGGNIASDYVSPVLGPSMQENAYKLGKRILSALAYAAEIPANTWNIEK